MFARDASTTSPPSGIARRVRRDTPRLMAEEPPTTSSPTSALCSASSFETLTGSKVRFASRTLMRLRHQQSPGTRAPATPEHAPRPGARWRRGRRPSPGQPGSGLVRGAPAGNRGPLRFPPGREGVEETATTGGPGGRSGMDRPVRVVPAAVPARRTGGLSNPDRRARGSKPEVGPLQVAFVYCRRCGGTIAHTLTDTDERPRFSPSGDVSTGFVGSFVREDQASFTLVPVRRERAALAREFPDELWNAVAPSRPRTSARRGGSGSPCGAGM